MAIHDSKFPTFRKLLRAVFNWRNARRALLGTAALATLVVGFYLEELWRGQRAWEAYRREIEALGGTIDLQKLTPPPVPDEQNFAMTPLLKPLFSENSPAQNQKSSTELGDRLMWVDAGGKYLENFLPPVSGSWFLGQTVDLQAWRKSLGQPDLLQALKKYDPVLDEISLASRRPYFRPTLDIRKVNLAEFGTFLQLSRRYVVRALAELADGQTARAADDTITIFQLAKAEGDVPYMLSQLTALTDAGQAMQVFWEGVTAHQWSDSQLVDFSRELEKFDYLQAEFRSLQFERALFDERLSRAASAPGGLDQWFKGDLQWQHTLVEAFFPRGWIYLDRITLLRNYGNFLAAIDVPHHRVDLEKIKLAEGDPAQKRIENPKLLDDPFKVWVAFTVSQISSLSTLFAEQEAWLDEAKIACALERFRLANGQLPEKLDELAPKFIAKLPTDIITDGPLHYQLKADGHFLLYEVGWDGKDDGGKVVLQADGGAPDSKKGDWVWPDAVKQPRSGF